MSRRVHISDAIILTCSLVLLAGLSTGGVASGKKKRKPVTVSCEQLYAEVEKTGAQLQAQYNAMGFTVDGFNAKHACQKQGKRVRLGGGFMSDVHHEGDPPFPGETNPAVREYFWTWDQTVTRTKKGRLLSAVTSIRCEKYIYGGNPSSPQGTVTLPC